MLQRFLGELRHDPERADCVVGWRTEPACVGAFADFPDWVHPALREVLRRRGIERLYSHQAQASQAVAEGHHVVVATPTASGKSLCYNLPVLSSIMSAASSARPTALYLFPTKALSQDQVSEVNELVQALPEGAEFSVGAATYDGDTPGDVRRVLRDRGDIIVTNPHMLHVAILPNHVRWGTFFRRLRYVVIDELHIYRGVFGSSVANVIRRLKRVARHYGRSLQFIASSATIRDPKAHFRRLIEETPVCVQESGAPRAERHHVVYNPPIVNAALGVRARALDEARDLARALLRAGVATILFGRSRTAVEVLTKYLKDAAREEGIPESAVVGYRGGYLPLLRREIEHGLRAGKIRMVAATNALELGVDIGSLDAVVMVGYPGSVASYHQQSGRAGRRSGQSASILVASSLPLDQYVAQDPAIIWEGGGEQGVLNPDNLVIATNHLKCAAFELPFAPGETLGEFPSTPDVLSALAGPGGVLLERQGRFHWMDETYPAEALSLDAVEMDNFLVVEEKSGKSLGHVDRVSAMTTIHPQAIYQHQGTQFQINRLDWEGRRAYAEKVLVDYYTEAETGTEVRVLSEDETTPTEAVHCGRGDVHITEIATFWKRIRFYTNENLETGPIDLPPEEMDTTAAWFVIQDSLAAKAGLALGSRAGAVAGLATLLKGVAPLFLRIGGRDLRALGMASHPHWKKPVIMLYDGVPGGVGLAEQVYAGREALLLAASRALEGCACLYGCPSCIGLGGERGPGSKAAARILLEECLNAVRPAQEVSS